MFSIVKKIKNQLLPALAHSNQVNHSDAAADVECSSIISTPAGSKAARAKSAGKEKRKSRKIKAKKASSTASLSSIDTATINFSFSSRKSSYTSNSRSQKLFAVPIPIKIVAPPNDRNRRLSFDYCASRADAGIDKSDNSACVYDYGECENEFTDKAEARKLKTSAASDHSTTNDSGIVLEESDGDRPGLKRGNGKGHHQNIFRRIAKHARKRSTSTTATNDSSASAAAATDLNNINHNFTTTKPATAEDGDDDRDHETEPNSRRKGAANANSFSLNASTPTTTSQSQSPAKSCNRCKHTLTSWFGQPIISCNECRHPICRFCSEYFPYTQSYTCADCIGIPRRPHARFWYNNTFLINRSNYNHKSSSDTSSGRGWVDQSIKDVRNIVENYVSHQISSNLDDAKLKRICIGGKYDYVFARYHNELSDELLTFSHILLNQSEEKPLEPLIPQPPPPSLVKLIADIESTAMALPSLELNLEPSNSDQLVGPDGIIASPAYEEILSTAIINSLITTGQEKYSAPQIQNTLQLQQQKEQRKIDSPVSAEDSAVHTDMEMTDSDSKSQNVRKWVMNNNTAERSSDDELSIESSSWSTEGPGANPKQQVVIEEHLEEITTTTTYEDSDIENDETTADDEVIVKPEKEKLPEALAILNSPEISISMVEKGPAWEHNWLFKRKQALKKVRSNQPVSMLVPNPSEESQVMIGNDRADDMSDSEVSERDDVDEEEEPDLSEVHLIKVSDIAKQFELKIEQSQNQETISVKASPKPVPIIAVELAQTPTEPERDLRTPQSPQYKSIEETMRETSHSLSSNQTMLINASANDSNEEAKELPQMKEPTVEIAICEPTPQVQVLKPKPRTSRTPSPKPETEAPVISLVEEKVEATNKEEEQDKPMPKMRIAEREKEKWNHPVQIKNNPYAPENLVKRMSKPYTLRNLSTNPEDVVADVEETPALFQTVSRENLVEKFSRDYYIHKDKDTFNTSSKSSTCSDGSNSPVPHSGHDRHSSGEAKVQAKMPLFIHSAQDPDPAHELEEIQLPSVRNLAQKFSSTPEKEPSPPPRTTPVKPKVIETKQPPMKLQMMHSLTARSVSREFREGLKQSKPAITTSNIKVDNKNHNATGYNCSNNAMSKNQNNSTSNNHNHNNSDSKLKMSSVNGSSSDLIASRAAFWDNRVKNKILNDDSIIDQFE